MSKINTLTAQQQFVLLAVLVVALIGLAVVVAPYLPPMRDFEQTFYPAIRYALAGQNPYTAHYEMTDQGAPPSFFSPAWLLLILLPFGLLPLAIARALWMLFLTAITVAGSVLLKQWGLKGWWPLLLVALPWSLVGILFGQVTAVVYLGTVLVIVEATREKVGYQSALTILAGLLLVGVKPQLGVFITAPLILWLLQRRDRRLVLVVTGGLLASGLTLLATLPWMVQSAIELPGQIAPLWLSTLERELLLWRLPTGLAWVARVMVVAVMGWWAWQARTLTYTWWSAWLAAVLIITPYTRAYDGVLLLPLLGQLVAKKKRLLLVFLIIMALYIQLPFGELGSVVAPLTAWLLFVPWPAFLRQKTH